ncbi:MAG: glycosyltransferase [Ignavibacteriales bacterium]|nr:glycosyltransferase [Ignavibacteriales bacterium]
MKITFACYDSVSITHGGPLVQILETKRELENLGIAVSLFDRWKPFSRTDVDAMHIFAARNSTYQIATTMKTLGVPIFTSPIFFTRHSAGIVRTTLAAERFLKRCRAGIWTDYGYTRQICEWSEAVLPNTNAEGALIRDGMNIPARKIITIPNGVDPRFEFGDPTLFTKTYGVKDFILNVGHIGPARKNVMNLLRALERIDHPAVIIGRITDGSSGEACVDAAKRNKNLLIIPGLQNNSEMLASAYAACRAFVLPSLFETPGIAALEAGLAGANIVITPHGGTREYFGTMARYVNPQSIDSICAALEASIAEPKTATLKDHIRREFLWSAVARKTADVYQRIITEGSRA